MKNLKELRDQSPEELDNELTALSKILFNHRMQHADGHLTNTSLLKTTKRYIARVKTVLTEKRQQAMTTVQADSEGTTT